MKINAVITKKPQIKMHGNRIKNADKALVAIEAVMLLAILCGGLLYRFKSDIFKTPLFESFVAFSTDLSGKSFFEAFSGFFITDLSVLLILSILGTSAFGRIPILITAFFRMSGIGSLGAYFFDSFAFSGIKYFLLVILPGKTFMFFAMLIIIQNCFQTAQKMRLAANIEITEKVDFKLYLLRNTIAAALLAVSALIDTALLKLLSQHLLPSF